MLAIVTWRVVGARGARALSTAVPPLEDVTDEERRVLDRMLRVDQAGELGADVIYRGQYAVLRNTADGPLIKEMWEQEKVHLDTFNKLVHHYRVRPSALSPLWTVAGLAVGAGTALMGRYATPFQPPRTHGDGQRGRHGVHGGGRDGDHRAL